MLRAAVVTAGIAIIAASFVVSQVLKPPPAPDARTWLFQGIPSRTGYKLIEDIVVPDGRCLHVTNTKILAERPRGTPDPGEFTVMVGDIGESSLETGNGVAYQGSGLRDVTLLPRQRLSVGYWVRPGKRPGDYFYSVSVRGTMFRCR